MRSWLFVGSLAVLLFVLLSALLYALPPALAALDALVGTFIAPLQTLATLQFFLAVTVLGGGVGIIIVAAGFAFLIRLSTTHAFRLIFLLGLVTFANRILKDLFERARPDALPWFDALASFSFPSAHASSALALYGFIAVVLYARTRSLAYACIPLIVIPLVGISRIVLGAHHFIDVVGGYLLGLAALALSFMIPFERLFKRYG